ncbi:MAG: hypothetical protein FK731_07205 [Asgard group archaeon]|nr:hypothetical protein [Asgard group archaeon]
MVNNYEQDVKKQAKFKPGMKCCWYCRGWFDKEEGEEAQVLYLDKEIKAFVCVLCGSGYE